MVVVVFSSLTFSLPSPLSLFRRSFSLLSSRSCRLSPLSATMTMITRPVGLFLCTHGSDLPESQSAGTLAHSLFGRTCSYHATVQALVPLGMKWGALCWKCWKWVMCLCLFVFGCVSMCLYVMICVVFVVLPSMRWLLCGDDGSKKDLNDICNFRQISREEFFPLQFKKISKKKIKSALNHSHYFFCQFEKI